MDLHDYIQDNAAFWKDVETKGFIQTMNEWFLTDDTFAALTIEYIEKITGEPKPQSNWDEYSKAYVEQYLYDPDSLNEEPPENNSKDNKGYCVDSEPLPF